MNENIPNYPHLIDSHFHLLSMQEKGFDIISVLDEMKERSFSKGIDIGIDLTDHNKRVALIKEYPFIKIASGIGPWGAAREESVDKMVDYLENAFRLHRPDAIGEIGLDFYHNYGTLEKQKELLIKQIELAMKLQLPIIIHTRDGDEEMKSVLEQYSYPYGGIIHCFSSSMSFADFALSKGFLLSFAGPITYKNNNSLREVVAHTPLSSLLLETDSPFLAPQPYRGKLNTPLYISSIYEKAAQIKGVEVNVIIENVNKNFDQLFSLI
jgi:TatD DNase family protein